MIYSRPIGSFIGLQKEDQKTCFPNPLVSKDAEKDVEVNIRGFSDSERREKIPERE